MTSTEELTARDQVALLDRRHWRVLLTGLQGDWQAGAPAVAAEFLGRAGEVAAAHGLELRAGLVGSRVSLVLAAPDRSRAQVDAATEISRLADAAALEPGTAPRTALEVAIDALDIAAVRPFWAAVLGYRLGRGDDDLVDPSGLGPAFWFQQMDEPRPQRNRIHLDVTVPEDQALDRVQAALVAGGTLVSDEAAPRFWVLADPEGNEACVCCWRGREPDDRPYADPSDPAAALP